MHQSLHSLADSESVKNVFLFIADSVRADATGQEITSLGVSGTAVSASSFTASSVPSILTGDYPSTHRIWHFNDELPERPALMTGPETFRICADTIWGSVEPTTKPPLKIVQARENEVGDITGVCDDEPFIAVEHHKGGHTPYGPIDSQHENTRDFFQKGRPSLDELPALYAESVEDAETAFLDRVQHLERQGLLEETLVIYTSDHGELLGEAKNGMNVGHGSPMVPDVVTVPVVFAGAGLPDVSVDWTISGTDIAPTALSALDRLEHDRFDGQECWSSAPDDDRRCRSEVWNQIKSDWFGEYDVYRATSVWGDNGGYVFHHNNRLVRTTRTLASYLVGADHAYLNRSPRNIRRWIGFLKTFFPQSIKYGNPNFSIEVAKQEVSPFKETRQKREEIDKTQLQKLGYLE